MKKVSSTTTNFRSKILPKLLACSAFILATLMLFTTVSFKDIAFPLFAMLIFFYAWIVDFRSLKVVFLGKGYFEVDGQKIFFESINTIKKTNFFTYKITYNKDQKKKSFRYIPSLTLHEPEYLTSIRKLIK